MLILVSASIVSCKKQDIDACVDVSLINTDAICNMDYNPVCGCDGETYSNACVAKYQNGIISYNPGPCDSQERCQDLENPILNFSGFEDPVTITQSQLVGDCLAITYHYSGGCSNHDLKLRSMPTFGYIPPILPITLQLVHDDNDDSCDALLTGSGLYDLTSIRDSTATQVVFYLTEKHNGYSKKFLYKY